MGRWRGRWRDLISSIDRMKLDVGARAEYAQAVADAIYGWKQGRRRKVYSALQTDIAHNPATGDLSPVTDSAFKGNDDTGTIGDPTRPFCNYTKLLEAGRNDTSLDGAQHIILVNGNQRFTKRSPAATTVAAGSNNLVMSASAPFTLAVASLAKFDPDGGEVVHGPSGKVIRYAGFGTSSLVGCLGADGVMAHTGDAITAVDANYGYVDANADLADFPTEQRNVHALVYPIGWPGASQAWNGCWALRGPRGMSVRRTANLVSAADNADGSVTLHADVAIGLGRFIRYLAAGGPLAASAEELTAPWPIIGTSGGDAIVAPDAFANAASFAARIADGYVVINDCFPGATLHGPRGDGFMDGVLLVGFGAGVVGDRVGTMSALYDTDSSPLPLAERLTFGRGGLLGLGSFILDHIFNGDGFTVFPGAAVRFRGCVGERPGLRYRGERYKRTNSVVPSGLDDNYLRDSACRLSKYPAGNIGSHVYDGQCDPLIPTCYNAADYATENGGQVVVEDGGDLQAHKGFVVRSPQEDPCYKVASGGKLRFFKYSLMGAKPHTVNARVADVSGRGSLLRVPTASCIKIDGTGGFQRGAQSAITPAQLLDANGRNGLDRGVDYKSDLGYSVDEDNEITSHAFESTLPSYNAGEE